MRFHALAVKVRRHSIMFGPFAGVAPQGHVQPEVIQGRRAQLPGQAMNVLHQGVGQFFQLTDAGLELMA